MTSMPDVLHSQPWRWPNFPHDEVARVCHGGVRMVPCFLDRLQTLRLSYGKPIILTSAYRAPEYNLQVSTTGTQGPHTTGRAVDILVCGEDALDLIGRAWVNGFTGIGLKQHGPHNKRFVHLDDLPDNVNHPRPILWTYA